MMGGLLPSNIIIVLNLFHDDDRLRTLLFIEHTYRVLSDIQNTINSNRIWCFEIV